MIQIGEKISLILESLKKLEIIKFKIKQFVIDSKLKI
jgi:hypothetical protein